MFRKLLVILTVALLVLTWADPKAYDYNLTPTIDSSATYTSVDTLRKTGTSDVISLLGAEVVLVQIVTTAPTDSFYAILEGSNDEVTWTNLDADGDSTLNDGPGNFDYLFPFATAYRYYRMRVDTSVDGADTLRAVVRFKAGGRTNADR